MSPQEQELLDKAERMMLYFAREGAPIVFGRLEGIAEALETLGLTEAREGLLALTHKHSEAMSTQTRED